MKYHPSITEDRVLDACERHMSTLDNPGFCLACGKMPKAVSLMPEATAVSIVDSARFMALRNAC